LPGRVPRTLSSFSITASTGSATTGTDEKKDDDEAAAKVEGRKDAGS